MAPKTKYRRLFQNLFNNLEFLSSAKFVDEDNVHCKFVMKPLVLFDIVEDVQHFLKVWFFSY